ncbi:MAG: hypothetical protein AAF416_21625 [Pseudomonadota bacterium]
MRTAMTALAACLMAGCAGTTIETLHANALGSPKAGVTQASLAYNLPRTLIEVEKAGDTITMVEKLVPDIEHSYTVR